MLIGSGKNIFIPPLLYLFLVQYTGRVDLKWEVPLHLAIPGLVHISYITIKYGFREFYIANYAIVFDCLLIVETVIQIIYFAKTAYLARVSVMRSNTLISSSWHKAFLYVFMFNFLVGRTYVLLRNFWLTDFSLSSFLYLNRYIFLPLAILIRSALMVYTIAQSNWIKNFRLRFQEVLSQEDFSTFSTLDFQFEKHFEVEKIYRDNTLNLKDVAELLNATPQQIRTYLKKQA